jgi:hypothetical protein
VAAATQVGVRGSRRRLGPSHSLFFMAPERNRARILEASNGSPREVHRQPDPLTLADVVRYAVEACELAGRW